MRSLASPVPWRQALARLDANSPPERVNWDWVHDARKLAAISAFGPSV
jgi:hypothetical protein